MELLNSNLNKYIQRSTSISLFHSPFLICPYFSSLLDETIENKIINEFFFERKALYEQLIKYGEFLSAFSMIEEPYRLDYFFKIVSSNFASMCGYVKWSLFDSTFSSFPCNSYTAIGDWYSAINAIKDKSVSMSFKLLTLEQDPQGRIKLYQVENKTVTDFVFYTSIDAALSFSESNDINDVSHFCVNQSDIAHIVGNFSSGDQKVIVYHSALTKSIFK